MHKVLFGLLWFAIFYFLGALAIGVTVGLQHQHESRAAVESAAVAAMAQLGTPLLVVSVLLAAIGAGAGWLPGARTKKPATPVAEE